MSLLVPLRRSKKFSGCSYKPFTTPNNFSVLFFSLAGFFVWILISRHLCNCKKSQKKRTSTTKKTKNRHNMVNINRQQKQFGG